MSPIIALSRGCVDAHAPGVVGSARLQADSFHEDRLTRTATYQTIIRLLIIKQFTMET
jgi:hypothetical protein